MEEDVTVFFRAGAGRTWACCGLDTESCACLAFWAWTIQRIWLARAQIIIFAKIKARACCGIWIFPIEWFAAYCRGPKIFTFWYGRKPTRFWSWTKFSLAWAHFGVGVIIKKRKFRWIIIATR